MTATTLHNVFNVTHKSMELTTEQYFDSASQTVTTLATVIAVTHIACTARSLMNNFVTHGRHPCNVTPHYHLIITSF